MSKLNHGIVQQRFIELKEGDYFWHGSACYLKVSAYESAANRAVNAIAEPVTGSIEKRWFQPYEFIRKIDEVASG